MALWQDRHSCDQRASRLRNALLHGYEQNLSTLAPFILRINGLRHNAQVKVRHLSHWREFGFGYLMGSPHFSQAFGGTDGYGTRLVLNNPGCSAQNLLSARAWQGLQRVNRFRFALASLMWRKSLAGVRWWQSRVLRVPLKPHCWHVNPSCRSTAPEVLFQLTPRYGRFINASIAWSGGLC